MPLLAVPNVSEGRDAARDRARWRRAFAPRRRAARPPLRRRPRPHRLHPRRPSRRRCATRSSPAPRRRSRRSTWPPTSGAAPGDRRPRRLPGRLARPGRPRRRPRPRRSRSPTQIGGLGVPVFLYGELAREPEPRRARLLPQRRPRRALAADGGAASCGPTSGPTLPHPTRRRDPGHRPPAARRLQRRARQRRRRGRPRGRRRAARVGRRACPGVRAIGLLLSQRPRPGLDQRPRPARGAARRRWSSGCASWRRRSAPGRSRPSWSASFPRRRSPATPRTCRSAASTPSRHVIERAGCAGRRDRLDSSRWPRPRRSAAASTAAPRAAASTPSRRAAARAAARRRKRRARSGAQAGGRAKPTCRRPGAARSSAASSPR